MRFTQKLMVVLAAVTALTATAAAQNVVGNWKGKIVLDMSKMPKPKNDQQKQQMQMGLKMLDSMRINMNLKANKTYSVTVTGVPGAQGGKQASEGTWTQSGSTITITPVKDNGKPAKDKRPQKMTVSKDGKTITMVLPSRQGPSGGKVVFTR